MRTVSAQLKIPAKDLVSRLSYSHLEQLVIIEGPLKRAFYEIECLRGNWSVRELKRQIGSLYFERSGLSKNQEKLSDLERAGAEQAEPNLAIRDPYIFEFLGIKPREVMRESDLEWLKAKIRPVRAVARDVAETLAPEAHSGRSGFASQLSRTGLSLGLH